MIDAENAVFGRVREELLPLFPGLSVLNDAPDLPETLPALILAEKNNVSYARALAGDGNERYARVTYLVRVVSDRAAGGKTGAKSIADAADRVLCRTGFQRLSFSTLSGKDRGVTGFVGEYGAVIAAPETEDQNGEPHTVYRIYRK